MKIGPTAIPALWREHYGGMSRFSASEFARIAVLQARLMLTSDWDFHRLAWDEIRKQSRARMVELASSLVEGVERRHYQRWGKPGLRAQLIDVRSGRLVNDFVIEGDQKSLHVLNAISPGFTCCLPFADLVCDRIAALVG
jgi:L-2-hydroxyglutarate oxidase LhgO